MEKSSVDIVAAGTVVHTACLRLSVTGYERRSRDTKSLFPHSSFTRFLFLVFTVLKQTTVKCKLSWGGSGFVLQLESGKNGE